MPLILALGGRAARSSGPDTIPCVTQSATASVTSFPCSMALGAFELEVGFLNSPRQPMSAPFSMSAQTASSLSQSSQPTAFAQDLRHTAETGETPSVS